MPQPSTKGRLGPGASVSRRRVRRAAYRARRQQRHAGRHYFVDELLPGGGEPDPYLAGARATEYRRGIAVSVDANFVGISDRRSRRAALKAVEPEVRASPTEAWAIGRKPPAASSARS